MEGKRLYLKGREYYTHGLYLIPSKTNKIHAIPTFFRIFGFNALNLSFDFAQDGELVEPFRI